MGYYTNYYLNIDKAPTDSWIDINTAFTHLKYFEDYWDEYKDSDLLSSPQYINDTFLYEEIKWYEADEDMCTIAKQFPNTTFVLYGDGEDRDDRWRNIYRGDNVERGDAIISYPPSEILGEC